MSFKSKLIAEVGQKKAKELLSEQGKLLRSKVKHPYRPTHEQAVRAGKKGAEKRWGK